MLIFTVAEVAEKLHVTTKVVYGYIGSGAMKAFTVNPDGIKAKKRKWRITENAFNEFCQAGGTLSTKNVGRKKGGP